MARRKKRDPAPPPETAPAPPVGRGRLLGLIVALAVAGVLALFLAHERRMAGLLLAADRVRILFWAALVSYAACAGGMGLLRLARGLPSRPVERIVFGAGVGFGVIMIGMLVLGVCGALAMPLLVILLLAFSAVGFGEFVRTAGEVAAWVRAPRPFLILSRVIWALVLVFFLMNLTRAFEPPWEYDALEYHFGAPATWQREGRVTFLRDNVYSNMPQGAEMVYLLGMCLEGDPVSGATVGRMVLTVMGLLGAVGIAAALRRIASPLAGHAGALIYYAWPGVTYYAATGHIEVAQQFYTILALWAFALSLESYRCALWRVLCGVSIGLAIGVKYPSALFLLIPLVAGVFGLGWWETRKPAVAVKRAVLVFLVAMLVAAPWFVRNAINTGNPVYPLLYRVFGGANWSSAQEARWRKAHGPGEVSPAGLARETAEYFTAPEDRTESALLLIFLPALVFLRRRDLPRALGLLAYVVFGLLGWYLLTHRADRFLAPLVPALAALGGIGLAAIPLPSGRTLGEGLLLLLAAIGPSACYRYVLFEQALAPALAQETPADFFARRAPGFGGGFHKAMEFLNDPEKVPEGSKALFFPEARVFWCRRPVVANTPFDRNVFEELMREAKGDPDRLADLLKARDIEYVLVNNVELDRLLRKTPGYMLDGRLRKHILDGFDWPAFGRFAKRHLQEVGRFGGKPDQPHVVVYRVK